MARKQATNLEQTSERRWVVVDVENRALGRVATQIANLLRGKHRPTFIPHADLGDFVVVVNAAKIKLTGNKWEQKVSFSHSGYPGGLKAKTAREVMRRHPDQLLRDAVWGMLPKNRLSYSLMKKLHVYGGAEHPHQAQLPSTVVLA